MNRKLRKAVTGLLATSALALASTHASAALVSFDTGVPGTTATFTENVDMNAWTFGFGVNLGWNHTINQHDLVVSGGSGDIQLTAKQTATTDALPGFTLWHKTTGLGFITGAHQFNQVTGPTGTNSFMAASVDAIVGYGNAGATFTNADGDFVDHGGIGAGYTGTYAFGTDINGLAFVTLTFSNLSAGTYYILNAGSDFNNTSGKTTGGNQFTASVVPVPAAVWLFGSALTGFVGWSRRRNIPV